MLRTLFLVLALGLPGTASALADNVQPRQLLARSSSERLAALDSTDRQWLARKQVLRLGISAPDYPPLDINISENDYEGLTADYAGLLGDQLGVRIEVLRYPSRGEAIAALHGGQIDLLGSANTFEIADPQLVLSFPYAADQPVIVTPAGKARDSDDRLDNLDLAMVDHYLPRSEVQGLYPNARLHLYPSIQSAIAAVAFGRADAYLGDAISSDYLIGKNFLGSVQLSHFVAREQTAFAFALKRNNPLLLRVVDAALRSIGDGERLSILGRWSGGSTSMLAGSSPLQFTAREQRWLDSHPKVRVVINDSYAPLTFFDDDQRFRGITADVLDQISLRTGLKFDVGTARSVQAMIDQVRNGKADMIGALGRSQARQQDLHFTRPYLANSYVLVSSADTGSPQGIEQLQHKRLAVIRGTPMIPYVSQHHRDVALIEAEDALEVMEMVVRGQADAALNTQISASYFISRLFKDRLRIVSTVGNMPATSAFATAVSSPELASILDKALLSIPPDEMTQLANRWRTNAVISDSLWRNYRTLILQISAAAVMLVLGFVIWNVYLRTLIKQRAAAEQALENQLNERKHLLEALREAKDQADAASRAKTTFLATMSHEIRTPMNAVIGMLEISLKKADQGQLDRFALQIASDCAKGLLELIGDILDVVRIESGHMSLNPSPAQLPRLVEAVARVFEGNAREKGLHIQVEIEPQLPEWVLLDPLRFKQVLSNLVSNAIKFTEHGHIRVALSGAVTEEQQLGLRLRVDDTGIGISRDDQARLFSPFAQAGAASRQGTGLGLTISRTLCEMMGGQLTLTSTPGVGTCVEIALTLPLAAPPEPAQAVADPALPNDAAVLRILVVDDYPANLMLLEKQLSYLGHQVTQAGDGAQGLQAWLATPFDVVITDCNMPVMDGHQLAREIRSHERQQGRPPCRILGFTANAQVQERERCIDSGMDDCLFKPIGLAELSRHLHADGVVAATVFTLAQSDFSFDNLKQLTLGDPALIARLLDELARSNQAELQALSAYRASADFEGLADLVHKIKGGARMVKARTVFGHCEQLEHGINAGLPAPEIGQLIQTLEESLRALGSQLLRQQAQT
ncbi:Sensor histidine kinase RcsC [compost metagenome]